MNAIVGIVVAVLTGIVGSIIAFLIVVSWLVPRIEISPKIYRRPDHEGRWQYRPSYWNQSRRAVVNVEVAFYVRALNVRGKPSDGRILWNLYKIPVSGATTPILAPARRRAGRRGKRRGTEQVPFLCERKMSDEDIERLPDELAARARAGAATFEDLMHLGERAEAHLVIFGCDARSGLRKPFQRSFTLADVVVKET